MPSPYVNNTPTEDGLLKTEENGIKRKTHSFIYGI